MKCTTRAEAIGRYGPIDLTTGYWPEQSTWLKMFQVPTGVFPYWKVLDTNIPVTHILCNIDIHYPLSQALQAVQDAGLTSLLDTFDGCFNIRVVRGSVFLISTHAYGLALDLNAKDNPLGSTANGFYNHPDFVKCFTDQDFSWGGSWIHRKDPMHFSYAWE